MKILHCLSFLFTATLLLAVTASNAQEQTLRHQSKTLSWQEIQQVIQRLGLPHMQKNKKADFSNQYVDLNDGTILDRATGLIWQKDGAEQQMDHQGAGAYVEQLNQQQFAGAENWRLPTAEELGSLVENKKNPSRFYIDPIFKGQKGTWSGDISSEPSSRNDGSVQAWFANFFYGYGLNWEGSKQKWGVRAVRSANGQSAGSSSSAPAASTTLFNNWNKASVENGAAYLPLFELQETQTITHIINYHWNNGNGQPPGFISIVDETGRIYGSWQAIGTTGTNNAKNVNWEIKPNIELEPGAYFVVDSHMPSWSANAGSNYFGFTQVMIGSPGSSNDAPSTAPATAIEQFKKHTGFAVSYHNINIPGKGQYLYVPLEECAQACLDTSACKSFDYLRSQKKCALNDVAKDKAGSAWSKAAEYDNYEKQP